MIHLLANIGTALLLYVLVGMSFAGIIIKYEDTHGNQMGDEVALVWCFFVMFWPVLAPAWVVAKIIKYVR